MVSLELYEQTTSSLGPCLGTLHTILSASTNQTGKYVFLEIAPKFVAGHITVHYSFFEYIARHWSVIWNGGLCLFGLSINTCSSNVTIKHCLQEPTLASNIIQCYDISRKAHVDNRGLTWVQTWLFYIVHKWCFLVDKTRECLVRGKYYKVHHLLTTKIWSTPKIPLHSIFLLYPQVFIWDIRASAGDF